MKFIELDIEHFRDQARLFRGRAADARSEQSRADFLAAAEAIEGFVADVLREGMIESPDGNSGSRSPE